MEWINLESQVISKMQAILCHVMVWIDPTWTYPSAASQQLKDFQWCDEASSILFSQYADSKAHAGEFLDKLKEEVSNENMWCDNSIKPQVSKISPWLEFRV